MSQHLAYFLAGTFSGFVLAFLVVLKIGGNSLRRSEAPETRRTELLPEKNLQ